METINFGEFKRQVDREAKDIYEDVKNKANTAIAWGMQHPGEALAILGLGAGVVKKGTSAWKTRMEDERRRYDFYDPRTGAHSRAKRCMTKEQAVQIERRWREGKESYKEILYSMGLLKY